MPRSTEPQVASPARRHFLSVSATAAGKAMALGAVVLSSSQAKADTGEGLLDLLGLGWARHHHHEGGGPNCFAKGTHIRTPQGEQRVEDLQIGDLVVTMHAGAQPVRWIGRNTYRKNGASWRKDIIPLRVACSAVDDNLPHRDLFLSPGHGLFIDGFLMPATDLANGDSIAPVAPVGAESIEYFQIEMEAHAVIWAEGMPVETFGGGNYEAFDNFEEFKALYPHGLGVKAPVAPNLGTWQAHLRALVGTGISIFAKVPDPLQNAYERIAARAGRLDIAA